MKHETNFPTLCREARKARRLTLDQVARRTKLSKGTLSAIETTGAIDPRLSTLRVLLSFYNIDFNEIKDVDDADPTNSEA